MEVRTEIEINSPVQKVWKVFSNFSDYPNWNPFINYIKGQIIPNKTIEVLLTPPNSKSMLMKPNVLKYDFEKTLIWKGHLLIPGLFDGKHIFELTQNDNGTTTFIQREIFTGILVPFVLSFLTGDTKQGFLLMNNKLKIICENSF